MSGRTARKGRTSSSGLYAIKAPKLRVATVATVQHLRHLALPPDDCDGHPQLWCKQNAEPHLTILFTCRPSQCLALLAPTHLGLMPMFLSVPLPQEVR